MLFVANDEQLKFIKYQRDFYMALSDNNPYFNSRKLITFAQIDNKNS
jgi:hypothetical protein